MNQTPRSDKEMSLVVSQSSSESLTLCFTLTLHFFKCTHLLYASWDGTVCRNPTFLLCCLAQLAIS